jgi:hypothetical protein
MLAVGAGEADSLGHGVILPDGFLRSSGRPSGLMVRTPPVTFHRPSSGSWWKSPPWPPGESQNRKPERIAFVSRVALQVPGGRADANHAVTA